MKTLREKVDLREHLIGAAVGSGMTAAAAEAGGTDFLVVVNAGHFRLHGAGSMGCFLPFANANALGEQIATTQVIPRIRPSTPVFVGVSAQDPTLSLPDYFVRLRETGIVGVINFPTVSYIDGRFREALEEEGLGFEHEVEMLRHARAAGLLTIGFCVSEAELLAMEGAGVDLLCLSLGVSDGRQSEATRHQAALDEAIQKIQQATARLRSQPFLCIFGGPIIMPEDTRALFERTGVRGYLGGSSIECFPATDIISETVRQFKNTTRPRRLEHRLGTMIGHSRAMQEIFESIRSVARSNATVLVLGESGTGKELVAREIHRLSRRKDQPLISWNCGAVTESLAMSELFGHDRGAFTGANRTQLGKFEAAQGGTLFMDEVAELPLSVQAGLLRAIQEREIVRIGSHQARKVDVRLIAASNKDFQALRRESGFRLDLYYRLSTFVLKVPPLRERREDLPDLIEDLQQEIARVYEMPAPRLHRDAIEALSFHHWPGNIRELRNLLERCCILAAGKIITAERIRDLLGETRPAPVSPGVRSLPARPTAVELRQALEQFRGSKAGVARHFGVSRQTIYNWTGAAGETEKARR